MWEADMATIAKNGEAADPGEAQLTKNIGRVLDTLRGNRGLSVNELILKSGITKSTYHRKYKQGGWSAYELRALAQALDVVPQVFYEDADNLVPKIFRGEYGVITERYPVDNDDVSLVA